MSCLDQKANILRNLNVQNISLKPQGGLSNHEHKTALVNYLEPICFCLSPLQNVGHPLEFG